MPAYDLLNFEARLGLMGVNADLLLRSFGTVLVRAHERLRPIVESMT